MCEMKAWVYEKNGAPSAVLKLRTDWPQPVPVGKEILVKVLVCALNPIGWKMMSVWPLTMAQKTPAVPENDFAGVVVGGNLAGSKFKVGDEVFGTVPGEEGTKTGKGSLAEYVAVDSAMVVHKPASVSFEDAASFPLAGMTAAFVLSHLGGLKQGAPAKRVFINGGSGGVGVFAVQLAKLYGASWVVTTCSSTSQALVKTLGADDIVDYKATDVATYLASKYGKDKFDFIFDTVGGKLFNHCASFLKPDGIYYDIAGGGLDGSLLGGLGFAFMMLRRSIFQSRKYKFVTLSCMSMVAEMQESAHWLEKGTIKSHIDRVFKFEDAQKAYALSMSGRAKGKLLVTVN